MCVCELCSKLIYNADDFREFSKQVSTKNSKGVEGVRGEV